MYRFFMETDVFYVVLCCIDLFNFCGVSSLDVRVMFEREVVFAR